MFIWRSRIMRKLCPHHKNKVALKSLKTFILFHILHIIKEMPGAYEEDMLKQGLFYLHTRLPCFDIVWANSTFQFVCGYYTINISNVYFICLKTRASQQLCTMNIIERKHNTQTFSLTALNTNWIKNYLFISGKLISAFAPWLIISREAWGSFRFYTCFFILDVLKCV